MERRGLIRNFAIATALIVVIAVILCLGFSSATMKELNASKRTEIETDATDESQGMNLGHALTLLPAEQIPREGKQAKPKSPLEEKMSRIMSDSLELYPGAKDLLELDQTRFNQLADSFETAKREFQTLELEHVDVLSREDGLVVFQIPPIPEGNRIRERLHDQINQTLGDERGAEFIQLLEPLFNLHCGNFGEHRRLFRITALGEEARVNGETHRLEMQVIPASSIWVDGSKREELADPTLFTDESHASIARSSVNFGTELPVRHRHLIE
jgi:hypothetical protein